MSDISRKKAPKQQVVEISRAGEWGSVVYRHLLACGHIEVRKRVAPASQMACTWCVVAEEKNAELRSLMSPRQQSQVVVDIAELIDVVSPDISADEDAMRLQGSLASALGVPSDSINVVLEDVDGRLTVAYAHVFLSSADAFRLAKGAPRQILDI